LYIVVAIYGSKINVSYYILNQGQYRSFPSNLFHRHIYK